MTDKQPTIDEILKAYKRYPYGTSEYPHISGDTAKAQLEQLMAERERLARIDELERIYLVYGSKEQPASLDNIFSLGKKGEVLTQTVKERLAQLELQSKQQEGEQL